MTEIDKLKAEAVELYQRATEAFEVYFALEDKLQEVLIKIENLNKIKESKEEIING